MRVNVELPAPVWFRVASLAEARNVDMAEATVLLLAQAVDLTPVSLARAEQEVMIRRLHSRGLTDRAIGSLVGLSGETIRKRRTRWGLPKNDKRGRKPGKEAA